MHASRNRANRWLLALGALVAVLVAAPAAQAATPGWNIIAAHYPTNLAPGSTATYVVTVTNVGDGPSEGTSTLEMNLPSGLAATSLEGKFGGGWNCEVATLTCTTTSAQVQDFPYQFELGVEVSGSASGTLESDFTVSGGGAISATTTDIASVSTSEPELGVDPSTFQAKATSSSGVWETQAGAHPYEATTSFSLNTTRNVPGLEGQLRPVGSLRDIFVDLPAGFVGNARAVPQCQPSDLAVSNTPQCIPETQIGIITLGFGGFSGVPIYFGPLPVYNLAPSGSEPALFGFNYLGNIITLRPTLRSDGDYGVKVTIPVISQNLPLISSTLTFWGEPADPGHDPMRFATEKSCSLPFIFTCQGTNTSSTAELKAFLTNPTECGTRPETTISVRSWATVGRPSVLTEPIAAPLPPVGTGCDKPLFEPSAEFVPTTNLAETPTGLEVKIHLPQDEDPLGTSAATLKKTVVKLPAGLVVNPSSAVGLGACSAAQIGLTTSIGATPIHFDSNPATCPDASRLGSVEVATPLLEKPLLGSVYLAAQEENPFHSLLALYFVIEGSGIRVKLPGLVEPDPASGRLTVSFDENPRLPFEDLKVNFFEGPRASLKTPATCGKFATTATLTPWTSPEGVDATVSSPFSISKGAGGGDCLSDESAAPNSPSFGAGTADPTAAAYTPFGLKLARADGTQQIRSIDTTLPKGLVGKLAGIPYCSDADLSAAAGRSGRAEPAAPSCSSASQVGTVDVGAGAGPGPLHVDAKAYLAGPYKGAPLSLAIVTPAVAGPFDLGTVVVRTALYVDPLTTQIHAVSDQIPTILQGVPLDVRSIVLRADRPQFTLNPSNCDPARVDGSSTSVFGQVASLSSPFQVGGCQDLGFKPSLALKLKGGTKRAKYQQLTAVLTARPGDANIARASVALPHSEFLAQEHIKTICTRVQFAANQCPPGSVYGTATAVSPLLDKPLEGPVYLRSSDNKLPDMVVALRGQIDVDLVGRIDSVHGGIRTTFEAVPDAPVSKFTLKMQGGKKSLLINSRDICKTVNKATVRLDGQNGKLGDSRPALVSSSCRKARKKGHGKKAHGKRHGKPHQKG